MDFTVWVLAADGSAENMGSGTAERCDAIRRSYVETGFAFTRVVVVPTFVDMTTAAPTPAAFRALATATVR